MVHPFRKSIMVMPSEHEPPTTHDVNNDFADEESTETIMMDVSLSKDGDDRDGTGVVADDIRFEEKKDGTVDDTDVAGSHGIQGLQKKQQQQQQQQQLHDDDEVEQVAAAMTLEVAYQSLEMVRKLNLRVEFGKEVVDDSVCVACLRAEQKRPTTAPSPSSPAATRAPSRFGRWMASSSSSSSSLLSNAINHRKAKAAAAAAACFTCGSPVCKQHRSSDFGRENIIICSDCAHLFSINYVIHHVVDIKCNDSSSCSHNNRDGERQQEQSLDGAEQAKHLDAKMKINNMLEVYDRSLLVLRYSVQYIDDVALAIRTNTSRHNKIGLGSSATGMVAGGLGVAAACTIWTPVGPPLLLASILFGGGATAFNAGSEAVNYRCEPNKMADRILTLHSIVSNIAQLPGVMDHRIMTMEEERERQLQQQQQQRQEHQEEVVQNGQVGDDVPSVNEGFILNKQHKDDDQSRLHWTRTAMNGLKPLTMGALSAVSIVTEAREMKRAVDKIRAGNPCDKAERLLAIKEEMQHIPYTEDLSHQLHLILSRQRGL